MPNLHKKREGLNGAKTFLQAQQQTTAHTKVVQSCNSSENGLANTPTDLT